MLSNTPETPAGSPLRPQVAARNEPPAADPHVIIEVTPTGTGATNDTGAPDKPPGFGDPGDPSADL